MPRPSWFLITHQTWRPIIYESVWTPLLTPGGRPFLWGWKNLWVDEVFYWTLAKVDDLLFTWARTTACVSVLPCSWGSYVRPLGPVSGWLVSSCLGGWFAMSRVGIWKAPTVIVAALSSLGCEWGFHLLSFLSTFKFHNIIIHLHNTLTWAHLPAHPCTNNICMHAGMIHVLHVSVYVRDFVCICPTYVWVWHVYEGFCS